MSDLAERLGRLPQGQRSRLLGRMRNQMTAGVGHRVELRRVDHGTRSRASFQQEQMWFVDRLGAGKARNNIALAVRLDGPLDRAALHEAVNAVVAGHQVLHSRLVEVDGVPWQEPVPAFVLGVQTSDLGASEDPERELAELTASCASAPFDLADAPPVRAHLVRLADERHVLLWVVHHVVWDPGSTRIFTEELTSCYAQAAQGRRPEPASPPVEYADFAAWQRAKLDNDEHRRALADKWRQLLAGAEATEVMPDHPRSPETRGDGRGLSLRLEQDLLDRLRALAESSDTTVFTTLLAAFNALLRHWTHTEDVVVGTASASRPHPDLERVIGCFVQMITLRTEVGDGLTFRELVSRTAGTVMDAFTNSELPFEQVVDAVRPLRDPLRHPLFQIEFTSLGRWGAHTTRSADVDFAVEQLHDGAAKFDMSFLVGENDGLELSLEYNTSLYRHGTASALLTAFRRVIEQVAADPDLPVGEISLVEEPAASRHARELSRGGPVDEAAWTTTLDRAFRERATIQPDAVAVRHVGTTLDYAALDRWSEAIAHRLRDRGVRHGDPVAVCLGRGPAAVAALLGILKAGAHYLPVDPAAPAERTRTVLADAGVRHALVDDGADLPVPLELVTAGTTAPVREVPSLAPTSSPADLAYVLYTSGSSGTPKGVMIEHRSVTHFSRTIARAYEMGTGDRVLHFAPLTFDVSVFEVFTTLLSGGELVIATDDERRDPALLAARMRDDAVTVAELPPALLPLLDQARLPDLRLVSVGGEAFPGKLVAEWTAGERRFVNGYGPTEATVAVTLMDCAGSYDRNPPIGRPMPGHQAFVLDERLRPVPPGVPAELCVAGPGVARGYLGRPELTAERFVTNPYADGPETERLYRTGDLVRWLPGGNLEFLGRTDRQLKLRGHRIEPGEVEAVLLGHPSVQQAVAVARPGAGGEPVLAAYVTVEQAGGYASEVADAEGLRAYAASRLPGYMVPVVVVLDDLPLTPHGKVDVAALPLPVDQAVGGTAPRDAVEEQICRDILTPLLEWTSPDVEGDFFALGGSSLQATIVVSRVRAVFGIDIALADFFSRPTVAGLADLVRTARAEAAGEQDRLLAVFDQIENMSDEEAAALLDSLQNPDGGR
ncbi:non-ribosomal peptide synthetase [Streptomyces sp. WMMC940]|uniref:non-ribosomal peptide synthetase n=1 Tax=Streptomyces sp. WMMC940 TaxID=3015153 RepID=UPI0022B6F8B3|nr:amino acid adenylation domain-containing protein [Streptomyces sp. WMMC940]MCZ7461777.1 amino acid adenylation domain-containing protein [Streptomyces sp. WMMC940]